MRVVIVNGSPRAKGNSDLLCDEFARGARESGHEVEKVSLRDCKIGHCRACYACFKTGECVLRDDMAEVLEKVKAADVLAVASPTYFLTMSGQMKTFVDRLLPEWQHRKWVQARSVTMRVGVKCAERIEVDWAGDPMEYADPGTGEMRKARVFVACLPWSQHTFAEAMPDMGEEFWIKAHVDMFAYFGGSTPLLVPDNCRTGVLKNTVDELVVSEQHRRMAEHYGCAVVPARPRRPRDKGSVEAAAGLVERQAMAPLRDRVFLSLAELNAALASKVAAINARPFQKRDGSRESEYLGQEKGSLIPLPAHPYKIVVHKTNIADDFQGRAWGLIGFLSQIGYVVAFGVTGFVADRVGAGLAIGVGRGSAAVIMVSGVLLAITALALIPTRSVHSLE